MRSLLVALGGCLLLASPALVPSALAQSTPPPPPGAAPAVAPAPVPPINISTTGDLLAACNTPDTSPSYPGAIGLCVGYGSGVLDYHLADTAGRKRARKVCLPSRPPTRGEGRRMFISWAQNNPQYMDEPAVDGVMRFFIATFPCRR